jgi:hypothetical protein
MTQDWRSSVIEFIRAEARPIDKFGHQPRLYALATEIGKGMQYDDDILFAAAWMHALVYFSGIVLKIPSYFPGGTTSHTPSSRAGNFYPGGDSLRRNWTGSQERSSITSPRTSQPPWKEPCCTMPISSSNWVPSAFSARP